MPQLKKHAQMFYLWNIGYFYYTYRRKNMLCNGVLVIMSVSVFIFVLALQGILSAKIHENIQAEHTLKNVAQS